MKTPLPLFAALSLVLLSHPLGAEPVEIASAVYSVSTAGEIAACDAGDIALGGGGTAPACVLGTESICGTREHPVYDGPLADHSGWRFAVRDPAGTVVTAQTFATCLDLSSFPELAGIMYLQTASGFGVYEVDCVEGDLLVGGGAEPTPTAGTMATLEFDYPINLVDDTEQGRVYAGGWAYGYDHLIDAYYDNTVNLAVCLASTALSWWASVYLVQAAGTDALCEPGDRVLSGGGTGPRCDSGAEPACIHPLQYGYDGPIVDEATGRDGWRYGPTIQDVGYGTVTAYAICARADADHDGVLEIEGDCDPDNGEVAPDLPERCGDGLDNNCNGLADGEDPACPAPEPDGGPDDGDADTAGDTVPPDAVTDAPPDAADVPFDPDAADMVTDPPRDAGADGDVGTGGEDSGCGCTMAPF